MANSKVRSYLNELKKQGKFHQCFQQIVNAYRNGSDNDFGIRFSDDDGLEVPGEHPCTNPVVVEVPEVDDHVDQLDLGLLPVFVPIDEVNG